MLKLAPRCVPQAWDALRMSSALDSVAVGNAIQCEDASIQDEACTVITHRLVVGVVEFQKEGMLDRFRRSHPLLRIHLSIHIRQPLDDATQMASQYQANTQHDEANTQPDSSLVPLLDVRSQT